MLAERADAAAEAGDRHDIEGRALERGGVHAAVRSRYAVAGREVLSGSGGAVGSGVERVVLLEAPDDVDEPPPALARL